MVFNNLGSFTELFVTTLTVYECTLNPFSFIPPLFLLSIGLFLKLFRFFLHLSRFLLFSSVSWSPKPRRVKPSPRETPFLGCLRNAWLKFQLFPLLHGDIISYKALTGHRWGQDLSYVTRLLPLSTSLSS